MPPGGFIFDQVLGDGSLTRITGASLDNILDLVLKFRLVHGVLLAGVEATPEAVFADYNAQVCTKYPWLCSARRQTPVVIMPQSPVAGFEPMLTRMQRWIDTVRVGLPAFTDIQTATNRAMICAQCPQNIDWMTNCGSCNQNLTSLSVQIRGARRLGIDQMLKGCRAFGTLQELAVWLESPGNEQKYPAPPICWRLKQ